MLSLNQANTAHQGHLALPAVPGLQANTQLLICYQPMGWPNIYYYVANILANQLIIGCFFSIRNITKSATYLSKCAPHIMIESD